MRLPLSWLKDFVDFGKMKPQELAEVFTLLGHEVEKIEYPAKNLDKVYVGKIMEVRKHPNADKLRLADTRVGQRVYSIVCGGTNLRKGMTIAVALPGARVRWHGEGKPQELKEAEIRGLKSYGMICAADELGLEALFPGKRGEIIDLPSGLKDGEPLAKALGLEMAVLHLDITPNRADCFSVVGLARELSAALEKKTASLRASQRGAKQSQTKALKIIVENKNLCPKYSVQVFTNVKVGESPFWLKPRLLLAGVRPINNIVDITNYVMLETGEPTHAFDADKLLNTDGARMNTDGSRIDIYVRSGRKSERMKALDGNIYELDETMLVIADSKKPVAIAGVMGGEETAVTASTKNVLLEAAIFDPVSVRKTSRKLGLRSESSTRFEKGIAWPLPELAQERARELFEQLLNVKCQASNVVSSPAPKPVSISQKVSAVNQMLNLRLAPAKIKSILTSLGFKLSGGESFRAASPWWRLDIKIPEDLYEEVGRIYGLNKLSPTMPGGLLTLAPFNLMRELTERARDALAGLGYDEVYAYSFYGREAVEKDGANIKDEPHAQVANPINPNQEFLRACLRRNLLDSVARNVHLFDTVKIFEVGNIFSPTPPPAYPPLRGRQPRLRSGQGGGGRPREETRLAMVMVKKGATDEEVFRKLKGDVTALIGKGKKAEFREMAGGLDIYCDGVLAGYLGLLSEEQKESWKIKEPGALVEFNMEAVLTAPFHSPKYKPIPEFPSALRDLAFTVDEKTRYGEVEKVLRGVDPLVAHIELFDIYRGQAIGEGKKSLAFHVILQSPEKTLSDAEIDAVMEKLCLALKEKFGADVRK